MAGVRWIFPFISVAWVITFVFLEAAGASPGKGFHSDQPDAGDLSHSHQQGFEHHKKFDQQDAQYLNHFDQQDVEDLNQQNFGHFDTFDQEDVEDFNNYKPQDFGRLDHFDQEYIEHLKHFDQEDVGDLEHFDHQDAEHLNHFDQQDLGHLNLFDQQDNELPNQFDQQDVGQMKNFDQQDVEHLNHFDLQDVGVLKQDVGELLNEKKKLEAEIKDLRSLRDNVRSVNTSSFRPIDCADLLFAGETRSGVYNIYPFTCSCSEAVQVYCDMETDGGGWTALLKREAQTPQENFNRSWAEYKQGFGSPSGEYYLGNDYIHLITSTRPYVARWDWNTTSGSYVHVSYETFSVDDERARYRLRMGSQMPESTSSYNCYSYISYRYFSTYDRDSDASSYMNCASLAGGGFWYSSCSLRNPPTGNFDGYMNTTCSWHYTRPTYQVNTFQLKVRPSICETSYKKIDVYRNGCFGECTNS